MAPYFFFSAGNQQLYLPVNTNLSVYYNTNRQIKEALFLSYGVVAAQNNTLQIQESITVWHHVHITNSLKGPPIF